MIETQIQLAAAEANMVASSITILCVDDEAFNLEILQKHLVKHNYGYIGVESAAKALAVLDVRYAEIDVILLDRMMPEMDGIELLRRIKKDARWQNIPVIIQTAASAEKDTVEGIEAGAYYYLTKPFATPVLLSIVSAAIRDCRDQDNLWHKVSKRDTLLALATEVAFRVKSLDEAREVAVYLSRFSESPSRVMVGLTALLINAIEHGVYGFGYEKKHELLMAGRWEEEIEAISQHPDYRQRFVDVRFMRSDDGSRVRIRDYGTGFQWRNYVDFEPSRMTDPNGRGIAMARSMNPDCIQYNEQGNEVDFMMR